MNADTEYERKMTTGKERPKVLHLAPMYLEPKPKHTTYMAVAQYSSPSEEKL